MAESLTLTSLADAQRNKTRFINDNFDIIDTGTQGNLDVSITADSVVSETNFKSYSTFILKVPTGTTLSSGFTFVVPDIARNFNIINLTGQTCTVQASGAESSNVAGSVPANSNAGCHCDGSTNIYVISGGSGSATPDPGANPSPPSISSFSIQNQSQTVPIGFVFQGAKTFLFTIENPGHVEGNLTLRRGNTNISTTISPSTTSTTLTIATPVTFKAGQTLTFTLSGTATASSGGAAFNRTFVIAAASLTDYIYIDWDADGDLTGYVFPTDNRRVLFQAGSQDLTIPNTSLTSAKLVILQRATDPDITAIMLDGLNQIGVFTKTANAATSQSVQYEAWVSDNLLIIDDDLQGATVTINR